MLYVALLAVHALRNLIAKYEKFGHCIVIFIINNDLISVVNS